MNTAYIKSWLQCIFAWFPWFSKKSYPPVWVTNRKDLSITELERLLSSMCPAVAILERVDQIEFAEINLVGSDLSIKLVNQNSTKLVHWAKGVAFIEPCEVRWQKLSDGNYSVVIISDSKRLIPSEISAKIMEGFKPDKFSAFLWGKREEDWNEWREDRIPRALHYPESVGSSPMITVKEYRRMYWDEDTLKEEKFYRFVKLGG